MPDLTTPNPTPIALAPVEEYSNMLYGAEWMQSAVASHIAKEANNTDPYQKLQAYLTSPLKPFRGLPNVMVIKWWKDHSIIYPILARMA